MPQKYHFCDRVSSEKSEPSEGEAPCGLRLITLDELDRASWQCDGVQRDWGAEAGRMSVEREVLKFGGHPGLRSDRRRLEDEEDSQKRKLPAELGRAPL